MKIGFYNSLYAYNNPFFELFLHDKKLLTHWSDVAFIAIPFREPISDKNYEESIYCFGSPLIIVILPFLQFGQHNRSRPVNLCIISR